MAPTSWYTEPWVRSISGDAFKLYLWLRSRVACPEPDSAPEAARLRAQGYLAVAASSEQIRAAVLEVSRSTLGRLVRELQAAGLCAVQPYRRGYLFLLGEWIVRPSRLTGRPVYLHGYYADGLPPHARTPEGDAHDHPAPTGADT
jgi:hypothetical protein